MDVGEPTGSILSATGMYAETSISSNRLPGLLIYFYLLAGISMSS